MVAGLAVHDALKSVVKYFNNKKPSYVDDFKLSAIQYKAVFGALVACAIMSGMTSWLSRIECASPDTDQVDKKYVEEWCYANSTFIVKDDRGEFGISNEFSSSSNTVLYLKYYQWVTLALILQAAGFQIPRMIWKCAEKGRVSKMVNSVKHVNFASESDRSAAVKILADYYLNPDQRYNNRNYFVNFALCQLLYFVNVVAQIAFTNYFLYYEFLNMLPLWASGSPAWNMMFPKLVKCNFIIYGTSGLPQKLDVLCVLAMNTFFEKIYLVLWILLAIALCAAIFQNISVGMALTSANFFKTTDIAQVKIDGPSDLLLLKFLKQSLDCAVYKEFVQEISCEKNFSRV